MEKTQPKSTTISNTNPTSPHPLSHKTNKKRIHKQLRKVSLAGNHYFHSPPTTSNRKPSLLPYCYYFSEGEGERFEWFNIQG